MAIPDDEPRRKPVAEIIIGQDLDLLSIEELRERITLLEGEIARCLDSIERKQDSKSEAETFFRK